MSDDLLERGKRTRREMCGPEHDADIAATETEFSQPIRDFTTRYVWGEIWSDDTLPRKTRSFMNIAMLTTMHASQELKLHIRGARTNGATWDEIRACIKHAGVYSGAPALRSATRYANEVYREEMAKK